MSYDPSGILTTIQDIALLITKALPSDEERLAAFKLRSPRIYANIQRRMLNGFVGYCRRKFEGDYAKTYGQQAVDKAVTDYVELETDDLPITEQQLFISLTLAELRK